MTCATCQTVLNPSEVRIGRRRCKVCVKAMPGTFRVQRTRVPKGHKPMKPISLFNASRHAMKGSGSSWWTAYAVGDRRDREFMAAADKLLPQTSER